MGVFEVVSRSINTDLTDIDLSTVNPCVQHGTKPRFIHKTNKRRTFQMLVAQCKTEECYRCCGPEEDIIVTWNRWNPKPEEDEKKNS